jgi:hypothetical protein
MEEFKENSEQNQRIIEIRAQEPKILNAIDELINRIFLRKYSSETQDNKNDYWSRKKSSSQITIDAINAIGSYTLKYEK